MQTTQQASLDQRIVQVGDGLMGALAGLYSARGIVGDERLSQFLDKVEEKGDALWLRFKDWKKEKPESFGFTHFVISTLEIRPEDLLK